MADRDTRRSPSPQRTTDDDTSGDALEAGLRYATDARPGIRRRRSGRGFAYSRPDGTRLDDPSTLARIRQLAIPPAWTDVWIAPDPRAHIQATGRDARGRKQYRYHPRWRARRDDTKFERAIDFGKALPRLRARLGRDLARRGLPREKVLAAVVRLLELTLIRVGNDEYARSNRSFGLTTLRGRHADVAGSRLRFRFRGKGGAVHEVGLRDRRLAAVVRRCQELPGQDLFEWVDAEGDVHDVRSEDVNGYIREATGGRFTAKDFRTWAGTVLAYRALRAAERGASEADARHNVVVAMRETAHRLGNSAAVCRRSYVHPAVVDAYLDGRIGTALVAAAEDRDEAPAVATPAEEKAVVALLRTRSSATRQSGPADGRARQSGPADGRARQNGPGDMPMQAIPARSLSPGTAGRDTVP